MKKEEDEREGKTARVLREQTERKSVTLLKSKN